MATPNTLEQLLPSLLDERDVVRILKVSLGTVRRRRLLRLPPHPVRIGTLVRYTPDSINAFLAELQTGGEEQTRRGAAGSSGKQAR